MNAKPDRMILCFASAALAVVLLCIAGCSTLAPYRTVAGSSADCTPQSTQDVLPTDPRFARVDDACAKLVKEISYPSATNPGGYSLNFAEFDDQGRLFPDIDRNGVAAKQGELFLEDLRSTLRTVPPDGKPLPVSVVVFVHGWKHGASSDDSNVRWFRAMLDRIGEVERNSECPRRVIGLYAGWRGAATTLPDLLDDATFWTRKKAAGRVAEGEIRELLSRLRAIQDISNVDWNGSVESSRRDPRAALTESRLECSKQMRLTIVGHSFGGLIVYNALDQSLIRDVADLHERIISASHSQMDPLIAREGDLIVTINPAVEAAPFVPLWRAARAANPHTYHSPTFVSITSTDDAATRVAFPAARYFSTLPNRYPEGDRTEHAAAVTTLGQDQDVVDYTLDILTHINRRRDIPLQADEVCARLKNQGDFSQRYADELQKLRRFATALREQPDANQMRGEFPRQFCINATHNPRGIDDVAMVLMPRDGVNLNSPVWNISTSAPIVKDHSDLLNPMLIDFLRQLYEEGASAIGDGTRHRLVAPPTGEGDR